MIKKCHTLIGIVGAIFIRSQLALSITINLATENIQFLAIITWSLFYHHLLYTILKTDKFNCIISDLSEHPFTKIISETTFIDQTMSVQPPIKFDSLSLLVVILAIAKNISHCYISMHDIYFVTPICQKLYSSCPHIPISKSLKTL